MKTISSEINSNKKQYQADQRNFRAKYLQNGEENWVKK